MSIRNPSSMVLGRRGFAAEPTYLGRLRLESGVASTPSYGSTVAHIANPSGENIQQIGRGRGKVDYIGVLGMFARRPQSW